MGLQSRRHAEGDRQSADRLVWTNLIALVSAIGPALLKGAAYLGAIFGIYRAGEIEVEKNDAQSTVKEARQAAQNRSDIAGLTDADLDRELQPPHK